MATTCHLNLFATIYCYHIYCTISFHLTPFGVLIAHTIHNSQYIFPVIAQWFNLYAAFIVRELGCLFFIVYLCTSTLVCVLAGVCVSNLHFICAPNSNSNNNLMWSMRYFTVPSTNLSERTLFFSFCIAHFDRLFFHCWKWTQVNG